MCRSRLVTDVDGQTLAVLHAHAVGHALLVGVPDGELLDAGHAPAGERGLETPLVLARLVDHHLGVSQALGLQHPRERPHVARATERLRLVVDELERLPGHVHHRLVLGVQLLELELTCALDEFLNCGVLCVCCMCVSYVCCVKAYRHSMTCLGRQRRRRSGAG